MAVRTRHKIASESLVWGAIEVGLVLFLNPLGNLAKNITTLSLFAVSVTVGYSLADYGKAVKALLLSQLVAYVLFAVRFSMLAVAINCQPLLDCETVVFVGPTILYIIFGVFLFGIFGTLIGASVGENLHNRKARQLRPLDPLEPRT